MCHKCLKLWMTVALWTAFFLRVDNVVAASELGEAAKDDQGFISLFNGRDLSGWSGLSNYWSVIDGAISGHELKETSKQTFLILSRGALADFELRLKYRFFSETGNSGVQFRSILLDPEAFRVGGYQADMDAGGDADGSIFDEAGVSGNRWTLSRRGEKTTWDREHQKTTEALVGVSQLASSIRRGSWNEMTLIAKGTYIAYSINDVKMTECIDEDPARLSEGLIAFQLHEGFTMDVRFKDIRVKLLSK
jgi:hypothetical protein